MPCHKGLLDCLFFSSQACLFFSIHRQFGFATGCEATAMPRRLGPLKSWAAPLVRALRF